MVDLADEIGDRGFGLSNEGEWSAGGGIDDTIVTMRQQLLEGNAAARAVILHITPERQRYRAELVQHFAIQEPLKRELLTTERVQWLIRKIDRERRESMYSSLLDETLDNTKLHTSVRRLLLGESLERAIAAFPAEETRRSKRPSQTASERAKRRPR